jgi:hypothetical protein
MEFCQGNCALILKRDPVSENFPLKFPPLEAQCRIPRFLIDNPLTPIVFLNAHAPLMLESKILGLTHRICWNPASQYSFLTGRAIFIGLLSADQHKQIGILIGVTSVKMRIGFIKQN